MANLNKVIIIGNIGKNCEMRYTPSGTAIATFSVATNRKYKNNAGEEVKETEWFTVDIWGAQAETALQNCRKGRSVYVEGRLKTDEWEKDGQKHSRTKLVAHTYQIVNWGKEEAQEEAEEEEGLDIPMQA